MSLANQIQELEDELQGAIEEARRYERTCNSLQDENEDLSMSLTDAEAFIAYVDKTNPMLRTAWEATRILEGERP
jgi:DNA repair exonuclease SbcCD ATPase subunit